MWVGFCQKRRFWLQSKKKIVSFKQLQKYILKKPPKNGQVMIALYVNQLKLIILKR